MRATTPRPPARASPSTGCRARRSADNYADFYDGSWDSIAGKTESGGTPLIPQIIWTGSNSDGTKHTNHAGHSSRVQVGSASTNHSNLAPLSHSNWPRTGTVHLYALSPVLTVAGGTTTDTTRPTVTAGSTGYYSDAALSNALTGPQKAGANIYTKVTFLGGT